MILILKARSGLVAKKISVTSKGKTYQTTVYVRVGKKKGDIEKIRVDKGGKIYEEKVVSFKDRKKAIGHVMWMPSSEHKKWVDKVNKAETKNELKQIYKEAWKERERFNDIRSKQRKDFYKDVSKLINSKNDKEYERGLDLLNAAGVSDKMIDGVLNEGGGSKQLLDRIIRLPKQYDKLDLGEYESYTRKDVNKMNSAIKEG